MMYHKFMTAPRRFLIHVVLALTAVLSLTVAARETLGAERSVELVMLEQALCEWCDAWNEEVGLIYPKSWEGRAAPLRRVDIHDQRPVDLAGIPGTRFTPTFVLMVDGTEKGRITGYPGEDFFWGLLEGILHDAGIFAPESQ